MKQVCLKFVTVEHCYGMIVRHKYALGRIPWRFNTLHALFLLESGLVTRTYVRVS
jgi:hypothetical protein